MKQSEELMNSERKMNSMTTTTTIADSEQPNSWLESTPVLVRIGSMNRLSRLKRFIEPAQTIRRAGSSDPSSRLRSAPHSPFINSNHRLSYLKSSFELMNLFFTPNFTTSLTRRAMLLLVLMVMSVGSVWAAETTLSSGPCDINGATFSASVGDAKSIILRIYCDIPDGSDVYIATQYYNKFLAKDKYYATDAEYNSTDKYLEFTIGGDVLGKVKEQGLVVKGDVSATITKVVWDLPAADAFEGQLKATGRDDVDFTELVTNPVINESVPLTLSKAWGYCAAPVYARFQVVRDDVAVDLSSETVLTITGATAQLHTNGSLGYYIYNAGGISVDDLTATLKMTALTYPKCKVICYLSTGAEADEFVYDDVNGKVTKEPNWDVKFTYLFKNDVAEYVTNYTLTEANVTEMEINKQSDAFTFFGKDNDGMWAAWYTNWYLSDADGNKVSLAFGTESSADGWVVSVYNDGSWKSNSENVSVAGNVITARRSTTTDQYLFTNMFGKLKLFAPTGTKIKDYSGYKIAIECNDEDDPAIKLRYIFNFPTIGEFVGEAKTEDADKSGTQTVTRTDPSVTVDLASMALAEVSGDVKYARFYLTDAQGNAVDPTGLLTVQYNGSSATTCDVKENGFYIYQNGSALTKGSISVSLAASKRYTTYKVVALFSTDETNILTADGIVYEEPDYDLKYTYSFGYTITTKDEEKQIEWDATAMEADALAADIDTDWETSLEELAAGQTIKWWVENGSHEKQALAKGTERTAETWTIGLPDAFDVAGNVASLSGQTAIEAGQLESWVKTNVYAPSEATYASVYDCKIICEVYTNNEGTGNPNARYTFSLHKGFSGSLKSTATTATIRMNPAAGDLEVTIKPEMPSGTKYARFYLTTASGTAVDPSGKLIVTSGKTILQTVESYEAEGGVKLGTYLYNASGLSSAEIKLSLTAAELDQYHIVMVTSDDEAVVSGGDVISEPDWDTQTTWWFKYPVTAKSVAEEVEWSPQSMQIVAADIEADDNKGADYLANNLSHYTIVWEVQDESGNKQRLRLGSSRVNDYWSISVNGDPFALAADSRSLSTVNNAALSTTTWANWSAPVVYAPANKTLREIAAEGIRFVMKFYEDDQ